MLDFLLDCSTVRYVIGSKSVNLSLAAFFFFSSYSSISSVLLTIDRNLISISFSRRDKKEKKKDKETKGEFDLSNPYVPIYAENHNNSNNHNIFF